MNKLLSFLCTFVLGVTVVIAQNNGIVISEEGNKGTTVESNHIISGKIIDKNTQKPLEYAIISLYGKTDSIVLAGGLSNAKGYFSIRTNQKNFFLKVEFIAYQDKIIENIKLTDDNSKLNLGTIELVQSSEVLESVEVRANKSSIMVSLDKRVFNVGKDLVSKGGTAEDILRNVPGVWVDINGNVSLRSNGGVRILLDGQTSLLISGKNADGLRQIQANSIERIEVITNPSARFEAEGMAGIVNIVLKKNQNVGLNGALSSNAGYPNNFGLGVNLNYRKNKVNIFTGAGIWSINRPGTGFYRNQFFNSENADSTLFSNLDRTHNRGSMPINFKLGGDYYLNAKNTLTASFSYRGSEDHNTSNLVYQDAYGSIDNVHIITERQENEIGDEGNLNAFIRHRKSFAEKEHQLTTSIQYETEMEKEISIYDELYFDGNYLPLNRLPYRQLTSNASNNRQLVVKSDYVLPIGKSTNIESGFQSSFRSITDNYRVSEEVDNVEIPDSNFINDFSYQEIIHGIYLNYGKKMSAFSFQVGLRGEYSDIESGLAVKGETNIREYVDMFPSAFVGYDLSQNNAIQMSYGRRIERPTFLDLTPFFTLRDRRNIWRGNPNIRPEYSNVFELGYVKYWDKGTLSAVTYYRKTDDVIKRIQRVDENFPETTLTQAENLTIKKNFGIEFTYLFTLAKWWQTNGDMNFFHSFSEGTYQYQRQNIYVGGKSFSLTSKTISRFTFWEKLNAQLTLNYAAPRTTTQGVNKAMIALDFATSMDVIHNNGTITLNVSDLFNSRRRRSFSQDETFYSEDNFLWQSRAIILSFHYRLNQQKKQSQIYSSPIKEDNEERF